MIPEFGCIICVDRDLRKTMSNQEKRLKLLLVEDHRVTLEGLDSWLSRSGDFEVVGRSVNKDGVCELARSLTPDVILLDLHLPGERSIEETIKELIDLNVKVVIFSAEDRSHLVRLVMKMGVAAFLSKSEDYDVISQVIKDVANGATGYVSRALRKKQGRIVTPAEEEILTMLARGLKYNDIAETRKTSPHTIRKQCDRLQLKLGMQSRESLLVWAVENGYGKDCQGT